jgi:hypothetical protein
MEPAILLHEVCDYGVVKDEALLRMTLVDVLEDSDLMAKLRVWRCRENINGFEQAQQVKANRQSVRHVDRCEDIIREADAPHDVHLHRSRPRRSFCVRISQGSWMLIERRICHAPLLLPHQLEGPNLLGSRWVRFTRPLGAEDHEMTDAIWHEVFAKQLHPGEVLIITDVTDQVLFVSGP